MNVIPQDDLPLYSRVAHAWKKARARDRELSLAHALMAVLLFDRVGSAGLDRAWPEEEVPEPQSREAVLTLSRAFRRRFDDAAALSEQHLQQAVDLAVNAGR